MDDDTLHLRIREILSNSNLPPSQLEAVLEHQHELEASRAYLRSLCDLLPDSVFLKNAQGRYVYVNTAFARSIGKPADGIVGKTDRDIFEKPRADFLKKEDLEALSARRTIQDRIESHKRADGSDVWVSVSKAPVLGADASPLGIAGYYREIRDRKKGEETLQDVICKARCILWIAHVKKVDREYKWRTEVLSSRLSRLELGLSEDGNELWNGLVSADDLAQMNEVARNALRRNAAGYEHEFSIRGLDGSTRNLREVVRLTSLTTQEWELVGVAVDVTEQEQAEKELQRSLSIVSATIESTEDGVLVVSNQGKIIFFNTRFAEMWGIPEHIILSCDDGQAIEYASSLLLDEQDFRSKIEEAYSRPDAIYYDILKFKDGRVFERHSHPQRAQAENNGRVWIFRDISKRARMEEQLAAANARLIKMVKEDALTGLLNRRTILEGAELEWSRWQRTRKPFSVLLIDIDDFKKINDLYGHINGDRALRAVAEAVRESVRALDSTGRYGGEEFIVILPETPLEGATIVAEKILENIRKLKLDCDGTPHQVTASIGAAAAHVDDKDIDALIHRADLAMYTAKRGGKNALCAK